MPDDDGIGKEVLEMVLDLSREDEGLLNAFMEVRIDRITTKLETGGSIDLDNGKSQVQFLLILLKEAQENKDLKEKVWYQLQNRANEYLGNEVC